ncbi:MAG: phosphate acyltransferase [Clostridium sp.]|nr:phosphate acyltransferase [Clostridium sp.]
MGQETNVTQSLHETARKHPQRVVFAEGLHPTMIKAAVQAKQEGICHPILLGNDEMIAKKAAELDLDLSGIEIVNLRHDNEMERRERYAQILAEKCCREGYNFEEANDKMFERNYFGMMMVETGEADAFITGVYTKFSNTIKVAKEVIGIRDNYNHFGTMHIVNSKRGTYYIADTLINRHPGKETLKDIARLTADAIRFFNDEPKMAMISYSNFGVDKDGSPRLMHDVVAEMQAEYPNLKIDGEMSIDLALDHERRDKKYPFLRLHNEVVNSMIFTNLSAANSAYKLIKGFSPETEVIGPIQMGLKKPIHFTDFDSSVRDVVNIVSVAVIDAYVNKIK